MKVFLLQGGLSGRSSPSADQTVLDEESRFSERFENEGEAVRRARELTARLQPGGHVYLEEIDGGLPCNLDGRLVGAIYRYPSGPWEVSGDWFVVDGGVDFRTECKE